MRTANLMAFSPDSYAEKSVLAEGRWVKVSVKERGIHFISASALRAMGFSDAEKVGVYGYGGRRLPEELDASTYVDDLPRVQTFSDNTGIYFYAVGPADRDVDVNGLTVLKSNPFSCEGFYFLSDCGALPQRTIEKTGQPGAADPVDSFVECVQHEMDLVSPGSTGHYMVGEDMRFTPSRRFTFRLPGIAPGGIVRVGASLCTDLTAASAWSMDAGGSTVTVPVQATPAGSEYHGVATEGWSDDFKHDGSGEVNVTVTLSGVPGNARGAWLDWVAVNYEREISLNDSPSLAFATDAREVSLSGASPRTIIWDVTDPLEIKEVSAELTGDTASFTASAEGRRTYAAFTPGSVDGLPVVELVGNVANQNLHGMAVADMIIFTSPQFQQAASRLARHRRDFSGLTVEVVNQADVFNEFASGCRDAGAFRRMLKMLYDRGTDGNTLKYVLLMGRGSYDNRRVTKGVKTLGYDTMPLWQTDQGLNDNQSYTSDDQLVMLADGAGTDYSSDLLSIAVGRLPVTSLAEAMTVVDKIIEYDTAPPQGQWRQRVVVIADDDDDCVHMRQAESHCENIMAGSIGGQLLVDKIYLDAYQLTGGEATDAREEFYHALDDGVAWVSYLGHASTTALSGEGIMKYSDVGSLYLRRLPFIYAATCNFMRWDADAVSGAEMLASTKGGGVIGAISATRPVFIAQNRRFSQLIGEEMGACDSNGLPMPVGEVMRRAKNRLLGDSNKLRYVLLGDPAMRLPFAGNKVIVDSIAGKGTDSTDPPVLQARQDVVVTGHIEDAAGELVQSFNGYLSETLYDADESVVTEGRGGSPFTFDRHGLRLFAGKDSIVDGRFSMKISMPASVSDNYREATLLLSAEANDGRYAAGKFRDFYVYGSDADAEADTVAPLIEKLYLNHPGFNSGGTVNVTPMLIAEISDDHALNLSIAGVGQSMTVSIDNGAIVCSDVSSYYTPQTVSSGTIAYQLPALTDGFHTLTLRVWDTGGNSASQTVEFFVDSSSQLTVYDIYTSATPASTTARFYLVHDRPDATLRVTVAVYDLLGRPVWINTSTGRSDMFTSSPVEWNLNDMGGARVQRGIYIYRAWVSEYDGKTGSGVEVATPARKMAVSGL
ncbi:MAG: type IX secretion system sortase PorU [Muribaculaceae bacterium]|nr:type IX secretion system sortase PorU [Muribaculaceae bacterium]